MGGDRRSVLVTALAAAVATLMLQSEPGSRRVVVQQAAAAPPRPAPVPAASPVELQAVGPYDPPPGDGSEDDLRVAAATDGNSSTAWSTESYASPRFGNLKPGVGLVLDAGSPAALHALTISTDTPGFAAEIQSGSSASGPFRVVSPTRAVGARTTFPIRGAGSQRYYVVWITSLAPASAPRYQADVSEVTVVAAQGH